MTHVTCRLTAKSRDQLRNPTVGNLVSSKSTTFLVYFAVRIPRQKYLKLTIIAWIFVRCFVAWNRSATAALYSTVSAHYRRRSRTSPPPPTDGIPRGVPALAWRHYDTMTSSHSDLALLQSPAVTYRHSSTVAPPSEFDNIWTYETATNCDVRYTVYGHKWVT